MSPLCRLKRADAEGYRITEPREKLTPPRREIYASGGGGLLVAPINAAHII